MHSQVDQSRAAYRGYTHVTVYARYTDLCDWTHTLLLVKVHNLKVCICRGLTV